MPVTASQAEPASPFTSLIPPVSEGCSAAAHPAPYEWTCSAGYGGTVPVDGSLSEWRRTYVAHSYGPYGDTVTVNGAAVTVEGALIMPQQCAYET